MRYSVIATTSDFSDIEYTHSVGSVKIWDKTLDRVYTSGKDAPHNLQFVEEREDGVRYFTRPGRNLYQVFETHPLFNAYMLTYFQISNEIPLNKENHNFLARCQVAEQSWYGSMIFRTLKKS